MIVASKKKNGNLTGFFANWRRFYGASEAQFRIIEIRKNMRSEWLTSLLTQLLSGGRAALTTKFYRLVY